MLASDTEDQTQGATRSAAKTVEQTSVTTREFAQNVQSHSEEIAGELSDLLNETREKLSLIGLSGSLNQVALPEPPELSKNAA